MKGNVMKDIFEYYNNYDEDVRLSLDRAHKLEYFTTLHYIEKILKPNSIILDACAGTGAYCFDLAEKGYDVIAGDLVPYNVEIILQKNKEAPLLKDVYEGNILDLSRFNNECFDITLCLGAFYHLHEKNDRVQAIKECLRVTKKGGHVVIAYLNRFASLLKGFTYHPEDFDNLMKEFNTGNKKVFYRSTPEEMELLIKESGITKVCNLATDGVSYMYSQQLESLSEQQFQTYLEYHLSTCENNSILGYSLHGLYIGQK